MGRARVILVGNGPSVLDQRLGPTVDDFDIVVRFNNYQIEGYEAHVGTRTDFWFTVDHRQARQLSSHNLKRVYWWRRGGLAFGKIRRTFPDAILIDPDTYREIDEVSGISNYHKWSTGAIAAHVLLKEYPCVWLIGFDWWSEGGRLHYADDDTLGRTHKPEHEFSFLNTLVREGMVIDLNPDSKLTGDQPDRPDTTPKTVREI
jgi:hypothetical protein